MNQLMSDETADKIREELGISEFSALWEKDDSGIELIQGATVFVALAKAPKFATEGRLIATLVQCGPRQGERHKGWPRYFFDAQRAKREIEAWLAFNGELKYAVNAATNIIKTEEIKP
jgi:hypothetical protein